MEKIIKETEQLLLSKIDKIQKSRNLLAVSDEEYLRIMHYLHEKRELEELSNILIHIKDGKYLEMHIASTRY